MKKKKVVRLDQHEKYEKIPIEKGINKRIADVYFDSLKEIERLLEKGQGE